MPIDRAATLRNAEKLTRQGKPDAAIGEYLQVVEDQPRDWSTANILGDLYVRAGQLDKAIEQFVRIADGLAGEGFLPKAGALYKKVLKLKPDHEHALLQASEVAATQGLLADARLYLNAVIDQRQRRGDGAGAAQARVRLGTLDPSDFRARVASANTRAELDDRPGAVRDLKQIAAELTEKGRTLDALEVLREAAALDPVDGEIRARLLAGYAAVGDFARARDCATTVDDLRGLAERQLLGDNPEDGLALLRGLLAEDAGQRDAIALVGWTVADQHPDVAFKVVELAADAAVGGSDWPAAAAAIQEFVTRVPNHIPALLRLVELSVDGGLAATMFSAQAQLTDAYLAAGLAAEARFIAEDLVAREPWEVANVERLRCALELLGEPDPDTAIADRLSAPSAGAEWSLDDDSEAVVPPAAPPMNEIVAAAAAPAQPPPPPAEPILPQSEAPGPPQGRGQFELSANAIDVSSFLAELEPPPAPVHAASDAVEVDLSIVLDGVGRRPAAPAPAAPPGAKAEARRMAQGP